MNERVKELALNAFQPINDVASEGIADRYTFDQAWFQLYNQQFAELIVKECINALPMGMEYKQYDIAVMSIKAHFGVKQ